MTRPAASLPLLLALVACGPQVRTSRSPTSSPRPAEPLTPSASASPDPSVLTAVTPPAPAPAPPPKSVRLARLARIWGDIQYLHPYLWEGRAIDWDAALTAALPKVMAARTDDDEIAAVTGMLATLHDPLTRVESPKPPTFASGPRGSNVVTWATPDVLVLKLVDDTFLREPDVRNLRKDIRRARGVVLDLREREGDGAWRLTSAIEDLAPDLVSHDCMTPAPRSVLHSGYRPQRGATSGGFFTAGVTQAPRAYSASAGPHPARVVFVVNEAMSLPDVAQAMQRAGDARVVVQGGTIDLTTWMRGSDPLPAGKSVLFRTMEMDPEISPDLVLPRADEIDGGPTLAAAVKLAREAGARAKPVVRPLRPIRWEPDLRYEHEAFPSVEHRLLALFRFWNVIRLFYPYLALMEPDAWDHTLTDFIPRMIEAKDEREFLLTVAEMAARVPDSHVRVGSYDLWQILGRPLFGIQIRHLEGRPVVIRAGETETRAGIRLGDEVLAIDGEPFESRVAKARPYIAASNPWTLARDADTNATGGPDDSEALLRVRGGDGNDREVRLKRAAWAMPPPPPAPHYKVIDGDVGYVDLSTLTNDEVDGMFKALGHTRGIVFDIRKGPNGTLWTIAPYLNVHDTVVHSPISRRLVGTANPHETEARFSFRDPMETRDVPAYTGKTAILIDEDTQSQAESTAMIFQAENGTTLVGSATAGADGDISRTCIAGNVCISFSGQDVRRPDGGQLQRVGLAPDVAVRPTIAGLRSGRDEVLERALGVLRQAK